MIKSVVGFITAVEEDLGKWESGTKPWFRGESGRGRSLCPKIAAFDGDKENYVLQSFRRQAGGLANVPHREHTDEWLFLAQHYGVPTRLLDWTEGALLALYFAINRDNANPRVFMLNPHKLNSTAGARAMAPNYPLSWRESGGGLWVKLAWNKGEPELDPGRLKEEAGIDLEIPLAFPATYQDQRMIAQRSCFTIHGTALESIEDILVKKGIGISEHLFKYRIRRKARLSLLAELSILGVSGGTIFPDLDHLAADLASEMEGL